MINKKLYTGYNPNFIGDLPLTVELPLLSGGQLIDLAVTEEILNGRLDYINYSVILSKSRRFPFFTATNIDGSRFKSAPRKDNWRIDPRLNFAQWGSELYKAQNSEFDRGHMTKREDVQWGDTEGMARAAADSTFFYSNAVPQHSKLNRKIWRYLEDYILHSETNSKNLKICVFTGPLLTASDPYFITPVKGQLVQIPNVFWKVVVFPKSDNKLYRVGFLMSHKQLLESSGVVEQMEIASEDSAFLEFKDSDTYQVNVSLIEDLTTIKMPKAADSYTDHRNLKLVLNEVDIDPDLESISIEQTLGYSIENMVL